MYGLALRILRDQQAAEDATIDVYTQVYHQVSIYDANRGTPSALISNLPSGGPASFTLGLSAYSSHDEVVAQHLHADLRNKGVRYWFAPEDLRIGDEFRCRIDQLIMPRYTLT